MAGGLTSRTFGNPDKAKPSGAAADGIELSYPDGPLFAGGGGRQ